MPHPDQGSLPELAPRGPHGVYQITSAQPSARLEQAPDDLPPEEGTPIAPEDVAPISNEATPPDPEIATHTPLNGEALSSSTSPQERLRELRDAGEIGERQLNFAMAVMRADEEAAAEALSHMAARGNKEQKDLVEWYRKFVARGGGNAPSDTTAAGASPDTAVSASAAPSIRTDDDTAELPKVNLKDGAVAGAMGEENSASGPEGASQTSAEAASTPPAKEEMTESELAAALNALGLELTRLKLGDDDQVTTDIAKDLQGLESGYPELYRLVTAGYTPTQRNQYTNSKATPVHRSQQRQRGVIPNMPNWRAGFERLGNKLNEKRVQAALIAGGVVMAATAVIVLVATKDSNPIASFLAQLPHGTPTGNSANALGHAAGQMPMPRGSGGNTVHALASASPSPSASHSALANSLPTPSPSGPSSHVAPNIGHLGHGVHAAPGSGHVLVGAKPPVTSAPPAEHLLHLTRQTNHETPWQVLRDQGFSDEDIRKAAKKAKAAHKITQQLLGDGNKNHYYWAANGKTGTNTVLRALQGYLTKS